MSTLQQQHPAMGTCRCSTPGRTTWMPLTQMRPRQAIRWPQPASRTGEPYSAFAPFSLLPLQMHIKSDTGPESMLDIYLHCLLHLHLTDTDVANTNLYCRYRLCNAYSNPYSCTLYHLAVDSWCLSREPNCQAA
jgi:hypothetical protein